MKYCPRLTDDQLLELKAFIRDKQTSSAEFRRAQAIIMLDKMMDIPIITEITGYERRQIYDLRRDYLRGGTEAIRTKRKGKPRELLTRKQLREIYQTVKLKSPKDFGYPWNYWTTWCLAHWIEIQFQVRYKSKTSYYLIFKRVKFTYHKPGRVYVKRDEAEVRKWQEETRPLIQKVWGDPETIILCEDEMILSSLTTIQKIWLPEGEYPQIEVSNTRKNKSIYGFLNLKTGTEHAFSSEKQTMFTTEKILKKVRKMYPKKRLLLLWDGPGWHRGSKVTQFIKKDGHIKVIFFPKYSPDQNPQEHVWKTGREQVTHNNFIPNVDKVADDFVKYLNSTAFPYQLLGFSAGS